MFRKGKHVKKSARRKHINILLCVLLVVSLVFAGTVLGKYIVEKTLDDKLNLTITGAPQGNTLMVGAVWKDGMEYVGFTTDGFIHRIKQLSDDGLGGSEATKIVFCGKDSLPNGLVNDWDTDGVNVDAADKGAVKAFYDSAATTIYVASLDNQMIATNKDAGYMFFDMWSLTTIDGLDFVDTSKTTNMEYMFSDNLALTTMDVSRFNTSKVTDMSAMFSGCYSLKELDVSGFDTSNVTSMYAMFAYCSTLQELDVSGFNTSKVTDMSVMFSGCKGLTELDASGFDTANVTDNPDTDRVEGMSTMFSECTGLTNLKLVGWDTDLVTDLSKLFYGCTGLTEVNLAGWNTSAVTDMSGMFSGCTALTTIYANDSWSIAAVTSDTDMFKNCTVLVGGQDTSYADKLTNDAENCNNKTYAVIDRVKEGGAEGYLTLYEAYTLISGYDFNWMLWDGDNTGDNYDIPADTIEWEGWDGGDVRITKIVFGSFEKYKDELGLNSWDDIAPGIALDAEQQGNIRLYIPDFTWSNTQGTSYDQTYYVLSKNNSIILANEDCSYMFRNDWSYTEFSPTWSSTGYLGEIVGLELIDTGNVTNMSAMFADCSVKEINLSNFDTSKVTDMSWMFDGCYLETPLNVSGFDTSKVTNMSGMFSNYSMDTEIDLDLTHFDTSKVTNMSHMFDGASALKSINISTFDTSKVTNMGSMFSSLYYVTKLDLSNFDTANVTDMSYMFSYSSALTDLNILSFDTGKVTDMSFMFAECSVLMELDISSFSTTGAVNAADEGVTYVNIAYMFYNCPKLEVIYASDKWNPEYVSVGDANDSNVFSLYANGATSNLKGGEGTTWTETVGVSDYGDYVYARLDEKVSSGGTTLGLFTDKHAAPTGDFTLKTGTEFNSAIKTIIENNSSARKIRFGSWADYGKANNFDWYGDTSAVTLDVDDKGIKAFVKGDTIYILSGGTMYANADSSNMFRCDYFSNTDYMPDVLKAIDGLSIVKTDKVTNMSYMFYGCSDVPALDVSKFNTSNVTLMDRMFTYCQGLTVLNVSGFDTSNVTDMRSMFESCTKVTELDVSGFNTSKVTDWGMIQMFKDCRSVKKLDCSSFDTDQLTSMYNLFWDCENLTELNLENWNITQVTTMESMFYNCSSLTSLDLSSFMETAKADASFEDKLTTMYRMFYNCSSLTELDLADFPTAKVSSMYLTFYGCSSLEKVNLSGWDTTSVRSMDSMFQDCSKLTELDLSSFVTSKLTGTEYMFSGCSALKTIYVTGGWTAAGVTGDGGVNMFNGCTSLVGGEGTTLAKMDNVVDQTYAKIDGGEGDEGYLTVKSVTLTTGTAFNTAINGLFSETVTKLQFGTYDDVVGTDANLAALWNASTKFVDVNNEGTIRVFTDESTGTVYVLSEGSSPIYANADSSYMLAGYRSEVNSIRTYLKEISGFNSVNMSKVTNMSYMFDRARVLQSVDLDKWDTGSVTNMHMMFYWCEALTSLDLSGWDTGEVTDMSSMFNDCGALSSIDVSNWDTGNVETMWSMFYLCSELVELDLSHFNTAKVTSMRSMFGYASKLTSLNLANWDTSKVQDMQYMFYYCSALPTLDVSHFDTSSAENMRNMFYNCTALPTLDVSNWNTGNVTDMREMFYGCENLTTLNVSNWNTGNVTDMRYMFNNCKVLTTLDVSNWSTGNVENMSYMFYDCKALTTLNVSNWDTSKVTNMSLMFRGCNMLNTLDVSNWDTANVTNMSGMFYSCSALTTLDVSGWNTGSVTQMDSMFSTCRKLLSVDVSKWNTANVTTMQYMFESCTQLTTLDLSSFDTSKVTSMTAMFWNCGSLQTIYVSELWNVEAVTTSGEMFKYCSKLVGGEGTAYDSTVIDKTYAKIDKWKSESVRGYLTDPNAEPPVATLTTGTSFNSIISNLVSSTVTKLQFGTYNDFGSIVGDWDSNYMAYVDADGTGTIRAFVSDDTVYILSQNGRDIYANADSSHMFQHNIAKVDDDGSSRTGYITEGLLTEINGLASVNTSNVTNMSYMFSGCTNVVALDLSKFSTGNVTDMSYMFEYCGRYNMTSLDVSSFDTSKVTNMRAMFSYCGEQKITSLDVSNFNTSNVTSMRSMFNRMSALTELTGEEKFNTSKVTVLREMFAGLGKITEFDVSGYNTSNVTDMASMFYDCYAVTELDLSSFNTKKVVYMGYMFRNCSALTRIYAGSNWSTASVKTTTDENKYVFEGCTSLKSWKGFSYNSNNLSYEYARIDYQKTGTTVLRGYLTDIAQKTDAAALSLDDADVTETEESDVTAAENTDQDTAAAEAAADGTAEAILPAAQTKEESETEPDADDPDAEEE